MANLKEGIANNLKCKNSILDNEEQLINESYNDYNSSSDLKANYELFASNCKSYEQLVAETLEAKDIENYKKNIDATRELIDQPLSNYCCKDLNQDFIKQFKLSSLDYTPEEKSSIIDLFDEEKKKIEEAEKMDDGLVNRKKSDVFFKLYELFGILVIVCILVFCIYLTILGIKIYIETHDFNAVFGPIPHTKIILISFLSPFLFFVLLSIVMEVLYDIYNRRYVTLAENRYYTIQRIVDKQKNVITRFNTIFESKIEKLSSKMVDRINKK